MKFFARRRALTREELALVSGDLPSLGDPTRTFVATLTEPEINAIYSAIAFVQSACLEMGGRIAENYWGHYGPTLTALSDRLSKDFDDPPKDGTR